MVRAMVVAAALMAGAGAQAGCWTEDAVRAAHVRDLQSMLMVATLRCQATGIDITGDYNAFVRAARGGNTRTNLDLKAHFWADGPVEGQRAYDRFTTRLANAYGAADTGTETCGEAAALAREAAADEGASLEAERCAPGGGIVLARR